MTPTDGGNIGPTSHLFQAEMNFGEVVVKEGPIYIKLSPGTSLYRIIVSVSMFLGVTPTKAGRVLIRAGYIGFSKFVKEYKVGGAK